MAYDNTNKGIISKNERKEKDTHPDIKGSINVDGVEYWLDGWMKQRSSDGGKFYSLSVKRKDAQQEQRQASGKVVPDKAPSSGFDDMDDSIPF